MQVLWSRALQARSSCRCSSCLHATTTLARRTTTAASKRRLRISDVFTACYSTILATAAFADARVKEDRRKEWDRLIEEVKTPSKHGKKSRKDQDIQPDPETNDWQVQKPQGSTTETTAVPISTYNPIRDPTVNTFRDDSIDAWGLPPRTRLPSIGEKLSNLDWKLRNSTAERIALRDVDSPYEPGFDAERQWVDELLDPDLENREPKTPLHVVKYEDMILDLVNKILHQSKAFSNLARSGDSSLKIQQELSNMAKRFVALNIGESRVPSYNYDDIDVVDQERQKLHQSLWALSFAVSRGQTNVDVTITKMCYNMLVSTVPPSITTYNILLNQFMNLGLHDLAQIVVDSFLYESRFKPNKRTIRLLLDHYRAKSDFKGFRDMVQRMRAAIGDMRIRRRHVDDLSQKTVEFWAWNNKTIHQAKFIRQKTPRSRSIFNSLILGSLEFGNIRAAVRHARNALKEGFEISAETLCALIKCVVDRLDAYAGSSLLRALALQWEDGSMVSITVYSKDLRYRINQLLLLCGIDSDIVGSSTALSSRVSPAAMSHILRRMRLDTLADTVERSAGFILQLDAVLGMSGLDFAYAKIKPRVRTQDSTSQRLEWALQIVRKQDSIEKRRCARKLEAKHNARQLRLQVLDNMVVAGAELVLTRQSEVLEMQIVVKKFKLQSLICETVPIDQETAKMYVQALTTDAARPPLFDNYPMFQQGKANLSLDPLSYLENNLFDGNSKEFLWHQKRLLTLRTTRSITVRKRSGAHSFNVRKRLVMLRVSYIKDLLIRYTEPELWEHLKTQRAVAEKEMESTLSDDPQRARRKRPVKKRINTKLVPLDDETTATLERYIHRNFGQGNIQPTEVQQNSSKQTESPIRTENDAHQVDTTVTAAPKSRDCSRKSKQLPSPKLVVERQISLLPPLSLSLPPLEPLSKRLEAAA
jgi:hypothetical protein